MYSSISAKLMISSTCLAALVPTNPICARYAKTFSRPVKSGWKPVPICRSAWVSPTTTTLPLVGSITPVINFKRVLFPAPFLPIMATFSPFFISRLISKRALCSEKEPGLCRKSPSMALTLCPLFW